MRLVLYGSGGHGREVAWAAREDPRPIAFMSDSPSESYRDYPLIGRADLRPEDEVCVTVGSPQVRRAMAARVSRFASVIAPTALIDPTATIGEGAQICDFCVINSLVRIGSHFQCNTRSHVHHDSVIGDFVTFSPGTLCLGTVHVEDDVFVGAGAILRNGSPEEPLRIGRGAVIGMGAVVTKSVAAGATVTGNPAHAVSEQAF